MFTLFSVISLATGVAVTTAVYSVVDTLALADMGVPNPERAAIIMTPLRGRLEMGSVSDPDFADLRAAQTSFSSMSAAAAIMPSVTATGNAERLSAEAVDGAYFSTLGIASALGRVILPGDDSAAARVAVLSDDFWHTRFAADPQIVGRSIRINGQAFEVIGVTPPGFQGMFGTLRGTRLWIPLGAEASLGTARASLDSARDAAATAGTAQTDPRARRRLLVFGRLVADRTIATASSEVLTIARRLDRDFPSREPARPGINHDRTWSAKSVAAYSTEDDSLRRFGMTMVALVGLVLVVACTNLANLVLARATARQGELAVRMAMGASRGRLIWEQCTESLILAAVGAFASFVMFQALAAWMTTDFQMGVPFGGSATLSIRPTVNGQAVTVALVSMLLALAVFGLEPAINIARAIDIRGALASGATGIRPRIGRQRMVIRWQVAIAAGFFIVATMFIRSTINQSRHDPGIEMDRIAVAVMNFDNGSWDQARIIRTIERVIEESRKHQAIETIAASTGLPFGVPATQISIAVPDDLEGLKRPSVAAVAATPSIFRTLGVDIVRGRGFTDTDTAAAPAVVIMSELAARQMFGSSDAVGRTLMVNRPSLGEATATVVGVAADTDVRWIYSDRRALIYLPLAQHFAGSITLTARSSDGDRAIPALREAIRQADPDLTVGAIGPGEMILAGPFVLVRSMGMGALYLGGLTLLLAMVGLFGVQSHVVSHRTREIGVRMTLGASARQIKVMVLKDGYRPVLEGLFLGLWGGIAGRVILRSYMELEEVTIVDPWMLVLTPIPLIAAAFLACYLPASRAASVEPTVALRAE
jgi:putative ABC transport system permease protein